MLPLRTALACFSLLISSAVHAQEFIGFDRASFGKVVLNQKQSAAGSSDMQLELAVGDYNNEPIQNYSADSVFARMGRAVGRLDILTDSKVSPVAPCTAFIVSENYLLTNHHCVPGILDNDHVKATTIEAVKFVAGYVQQGVTEGTKIFEVNPVPLEASKDLDFAILEVFGDPSAEYGKLKLSDRLPQVGDPYWVIGHPMGEAQRISREKCKANSPAVSDNRLLHTCDTLPGNSGSPVIDASLQQVVGLHHAGSKRDSVNFAIPMREILSHSPILAALVPNVPVTSDLENKVKVSPDTVRTGEVLTVEAIVPASCSPFLFDLSSGGKLTPIPANIFDVSKTGDGDTRYVNNAASKYGIIVQAEDERGEHHLGYICQKDGMSQDDVKQALRALRGVVGTRSSGQLSAGAYTVTYTTATYSIAD